MLAGDESIAVNFSSALCNTYSYTVIRDVAQCTVSSILYNTYDYTVIRDVAQCTVSSILCNTYDYTVIRDVAQTLSYPHLLFI